jgi:hypothetical protein
VIVDSAGEVVTRKVEAVVPPLDAYLVVGVERPPSDTDEGDRRDQ